MRPTLAASLALALTATLLPGAALATTAPPSPEEAPAPATASDEGQGEEVGEPLPDEHLHPVYGMVTGDPEDVALSEPTTVTDLTSMPAPDAGAEVYPMPESGHYTLTGGGFGHRIGMSQYGAHGAGTQGLSHEEILAFYYPGTELATRDTDTIRVGITIDNDGTTRVDHRPGLVVSNGPGATAYPLPNWDQWRVSATTDNPSSCVLEGRDDSGWKPYQPKGMPTGCPVTFTSPTEKTVDVYLPGGSRRVYRGQITATHVGDKDLATVNRLPMQHYLWSVVSAEMPSSFHQQGLRAQAVAARTYAERDIDGDDAYDICDSTYCQAYRGRGARNSDGTITSHEHAENKNAVNATVGQVLTYDFPWGTGLATTMYSSSTGGYTIPAGKEHGYLVAQEDPYDNTPSNARHRWTAELTATALQSRYKIHKVTRVQVLRRDGLGAWGGRVLDAKVEGYTASGHYTYAEASGVGLYLARPWPYWRTGLSTDYFTFNDPQVPAPPEPGPGEVSRTSGENRYETAAEVSRSWAPGAGVVYLVNGEDFPDALTAAARAGVYDAPVLLIKRDSIPEPTQEALTRLRPGRLVVVGGEGAVSAATEKKLDGYTSGSIQRVGGADRYETAADLASYYGSGQSRVFLASGEDYPDALAAAALAGTQRSPLLLTRHGRLDAATIAQLDRLNPREIVVLGGGAVVSRAVAEQAAGYATNGYRRLAGPDRYRTAEQVARQFPQEISSTLVASGEQFPDALVGAALAGRNGVPVVLAKRDAIPQGTVGALSYLGPHALNVLGGATAVSDATVNALKKYLD